MLIHGSKLNAEQRRQVLDTFVYRWTHENAAARYGGRCPACVQHEYHGGSDTVVNNGHEVAWHDHHIKLISDNQWLNRHAFHFVKDGSRLMHNRRHAEPA